MLFTPATAANAPERGRFPGRAKPGIPMNNRAHNCVQNARTLSDSNIEIRVNFSCFPLGKDWENGWDHHRMTDIDYLAIDLALNTCLVADFQM
jgi:hypothetical protein